MLSEFIGQEINLLLPRSSHALVSSNGDLSVGKQEAWCEIVHASNLIGINVGEQATAQYFRTLA